MRLFVSVDLPHELGEEIEQLQERFEQAEGLRFTDPYQSHVTLKFLGEVDESRVGTTIDGIEQGVEVADVGPFEATVEDLGVFPDLEYIRVLWVGFGDGADELSRLAASIETELVDRGFDEADHAFTPHVTIARMEYAGGKGLVQRLVREEHPTLGSFTVDEVCLTKSTLTSEGPEYDTVERIQLV